ncbi:hypothetical protein AXW92_05230 [Pseudomonas aeruginosa]|nr:hypothetical protein DQ20_12835 [Pseudomonas aeruginosa]OFJ84909.1 hypothetical protein HMPREF2839_09595 [Pseudomonas aeruginosa]RIY85616.1 hypothetical protein AXW92_05230 [Pseudomonas aeruginosa]
MTFQEALNLTTRFLSSKEERIPRRTVRCFAQAQTGVMQKRPMLTLVGVQSYRLGSMDGQLRMS